MVTAEGVFTEDGQLTIPEEIRARLGLRPRDRVVFEVIENEIRLRPQRSRLLAGYGAVQPLSRPEDFDAIEEQFEKDVAADVMAKAG